MSTTSKARQHQNRRNSSSTVSSPTIKQLASIHTPFNSMFHACQESAMLTAEFVRRTNDGYEQKRRADYERYLGKILPPISRQCLPNKIRLTMEIQYSDFASLYNGREAWAVNDSLSDIMRDTQCMVQFANQCEDDFAERMGIFNQVTITGDMPNIDTAMNRIRNYSPITIIVPLINIKDALQVHDPANLIHQWCKGEELREYSKVQFSILYQSHMLSPTQNEETNNNRIPSLMVRGSRKDYKLMGQASNAICQLLFDEFRPTFYSHLKIPASQRKMIAGSPDGVLVRTISTQTNAQIHYSNSKPPSTSVRYYLSGPASNVINAVRSLQDISPVRIEFEAEDEQLMSGAAKDEHRELDFFDIERAVIIQLRKSTYEGHFRLENEGMRHTLTLMTSEENVQSLYKVRQQLLMEECWNDEGSPKQGKKGVAYLDFLKVLVMESSFRAYIGESKMISVCRCNDKNHNHHPQIHAKM